jgi:hypothetical protein
MISCAGLPETLPRSLLAGHTVIVCSQVVIINHHQDQRLCLALTRATEAMAQHSHRGEAARAQVRDIVVVP